MIISTDDIARLGTILGIWAHPDDETFAMGGIMAAAAKNGQKVIVITATKGELGIQDEARWPAKELANIRTQELAAALEILGVKQHYFLDCPDGGCSTADEESSVAQIAKIINDHKPDSIFTFGPDGLTGHSDHKTVSAWAGKAKVRAESPAELFHCVQTLEQYENSKVIDDAMNIYFNTTEPPIFEAKDCDICIELTPELLSTKLRALQAMPSQFQAMFDRFGEPVISICFGTEAFVKNEGHL
jgi:LmbE family N-acetylglucosaminyl deacetylase